MNASGRGQSSFAMHALDGFRIGIRMEFYLGICPEIDRIEPKVPLCDKQPELAIAYRSLSHSFCHFRNRGR